MAHPGCAVCTENLDTAGVLWTAGPFVLRHAPAPFGAPGWLVLQSAAHVSGPAEFSDEQAGALGPAVRAASAALLRASGALRVYVAALGEAHHHFHMHLVPRYDGGAAGWSAFAQQAEAAAGRTVVDPARVAAIVEAVRAALADVAVPAVKAAA